MTEEEFWRREYICPMCLNREVLCDPAPKCCGHYMVEFEDWEKDKAAWLRSREYNLELERLAELFDECQSCRYGSCDTCPPLNMEFKAWDELSDEALENFEKVVEESEPSTFWEKIRNLASVDDWIDWLMGNAE